MKRILLILGVLLPAVASAELQVKVNGQVQIIQRGGQLVIGGRSSAATPETSSTEPAILRWRNGEIIPGDVDSASSTSLAWKTALFEDPLQLKWPALDRVDWHPKDAAPTGPFSIALKDGSFIYGDLVSVTADAVTIHSTRHGDAILKRSEVLSVRRLKQGSLLSSGPTGAAGWRMMNSQPDGSVASGSNITYFTPPLATGPDGALLMPSWNTSALMDLKVPDLLDIAFRIRSSRRPDFLLSLGGSIRESLRIETWDEDLVLAVGDEFKVIRKMGPDDREVALRVCWDKKAQKCSVYSLSGELVTEWQLPGKSTGSDQGIVLRNKGIDLALQSMQVREWNGKQPGKFDLLKPHVELADGRNLTGEILPGASGSIKVQTAGQTAPVDFPLAQVNALVFSSDTASVAEGDITLFYDDGTYLSGRMSSVEKGHVSLSTSFAKEPFSSQMEGLRQLRVKRSTTVDLATTPSLADLDKITLGETTLHGKLQNESDEGLHWMPVGGIKASRPVATAVSEIARTLPKNVSPPNDPALFYLRSGDVLAGQLKSMDRDGAEFESTFMDAQKLPAADLNAIQFNAPTLTNVQGFDDPSWQIVKGDDKTIRRKSGTIEMDPGTSIAQPGVMQSSEISFKYIAKGFSGCRLRLFSRGTDGSHAVNLLIGCPGEQFIAGEEAAEGQFQNQTQQKISQGQPVHVVIRINENDLELVVNDVSMQHFTIDPAKRTGSGLIFEPASLWGNIAQPVTLSDFSVSSIPGRTWLPPIDPGAKTQLLTVPRFQKNDPPRHALLAANGDVLRGEIEAATDTHYGFRCGMEHLEIPRDRVKAVIWLTPPEKVTPGAAAAPVEKPHSNPLLRRMAGMASFRGVDLMGLTSFVQGQGGVKFKLPEKMDRHRVSMDFNNQTVGEALATICSLFELRFHMESDDTIVLEGKVVVPKDFVQKNYWLKPDAIPKTPPVQEIFAAKGIAFPPEASAQWSPDSGLLTMTNTPENQTKLAALLTSDFGGSLGSPTHWLLLTSGARLALTVEKFGQDFITGHNPVYGVCKVPMALVYAIRTSAPDPTSTISAMANWRLVNAPDPVIPDPNGGDSPLLGKEAPTFKLSLLEGGDFDLGAMKGQVVVLDFWATWCGPCVQSLPGLIKSLSEISSDHLKLIGVNQGEAPAQVKHFLEARGLKLTVAMDSAQEVARKYGVEGIPHTVIIGPDGKIAWVQVGYDPDGETAAADVVKKLLNPPAPGAPPVKESPE